MTSTKIDRLIDRALQLSKARSFFSERGIKEVDVLLLTQSAPIDRHIDLIAAFCCGKPSYLQSSPEYGMKRLLSEGMGDIYQLSHVFRDGERGERHHPEFMMAEWYRIGMSFEQMIEETLAFIRLFVDVPKTVKMTYREAFEKLGGVSYEKVEDRDYFLAFSLEPQFGKDHLFVLTDFPPEEAALAALKSTESGEVAERFEVFYKGIELANGYHELCHASEQRKRLLAANQARKDLHKTCYPIDEYFLQALASGIPDCCGVAVGFDRLMMLRHEVTTIEEILPFVWEKS